MSGRARVSLVDLMVKAYALMTLIYPRPFRDRFGREMRLAFRNDALERSKTSGGWALLELTIRVLADWAITLWKEYTVMPKYLSAASLVLVFLAINLLTFHDWREPHTIRDYMTLAASLVLFVYLGFDLFRSRRDSGPAVQ